MKSPHSGPYRKEILEAVARLELRARKSITSLLTGNYRSHFRGSGMQFKEFRNYAPGDDIRHMSWPVTARTRRPTIKTYEEERNLDVILMIDVSGSSLYGSASQRKIDMYTELLALLGLAAIKSGDRVGLLLFNDTPSLFVPPASSRAHVQGSMVKLLEQPLVEAHSDSRPATRFLLGAMKSQAIVFVLSDFWLPPCELELGLLAKRHDLVLLHGYGDGERGAGLSGVQEIWDSENNEFALLDGNSQKLRRALSEQHTFMTNRLETLSRSIGAGYLTLSVEDDYLQRIVHFFRRRGTSRL